MPIDSLQIREVGEIKEIKRSIARIVGLDNCMNGQLLDITQDIKGIVMGFTEGQALTLLLGKVDDCKVGQRVYSNLRSFNIPVGNKALGRIVSALSMPLDGKGEILPDAHLPVFREAPGVLERVPVEEVFETGILVIDTCIPIGKGQRELIIGDRMTGKTTICLDAILNQKNKDVVCIYCCVGRSQSSLERIVEVLNREGALDYTIIVSASASSSPGEQYLAPYTACTLGEYFMHKGRDVFVVFDDLSKHAWAYRQLSLLLERSPGRDAYPGDIFYLHSQLMERAGQLSPESGGGSMTFFPIVDTLQGDITGYIPSNLISMTDGQIYLNTALFSTGFKPAIDLSLSVSRIGNKVQCPAMRTLSAMLRLEYLQFNELMKVTRFKSGISEELNMQLKAGGVLTHIFIQDKNSPRSLVEELILLYALRHKILDLLSDEELEYFKGNIYKFIQSQFPNLIKNMNRDKEVTPEVKKELDISLTAFFKA